MAAAAHHLSLRSFDAPFTRGTSRSTPIQARMRGTVADGDMP